MIEGTHEYFFELLTEEIPAWMLPPPTLAKELETLYAEFGIDGTQRNGLIQSGATSRRLYFNLSGLPSAQAERDEEVKGPPRKSAFKDETPTPALLGFLKKNGASLEDILPGSDYIRLRRVVKGQTTGAILADRIPRIMQGLRWPKMMRWGDGDWSYIRPVHSVISLLDGEVVPLRLFGVDAGSSTVGHRLLGSGPVKVDSYSDYVEKLGASHVVVEPEMRERMMKQKCAGLAVQVGGEPAEDDTIWLQWRHLTEFPGIVRAEFDPKFLELPEEVLTTVMRVHQKQLPIKVNGKISHYFLGVMDLVEDREGNVASGNSFVTNARFADARFFYETDRKRLLQDRVEDLAHLQFQEKLGNYLQKTQRILSLAGEIRTASRSKTPGDSISLASRLCKTDLMTEMVKEFTELQGKIGGIYAREEGLIEEVCHAIYDHYLPVAADDPLPRNEAGAILAVADRMDTLAGFFLIGLKPTGSRDPFALRRAAQGVVQILLNEAPWRMDIGIDVLIDLALKGHAADGTALTGARMELMSFFEERVRTILEAVPHHLAYDEIAAAMAAAWTASLPDLKRRASALREIRNQRDFLSVLDSARRIANITEGAPPGEVVPSLLHDPFEKRLWELSTLVDEQIREVSAQGQYRRALESFAGLATELEGFFKNVMVNVDDPALRDNRIALLRKVGNSVGRIADVTKIVVDRSNYGSATQ